MDRDSLIAIAEDLQYLNLWGPDISDAEIRRGSAVLRRLLVEGEYGKAWRAIGRLKEPKVIAVDLSLLIAPAPIHDLVLGLAAGAFFRGAHIVGMTAAKYRLPACNAPPLRSGGYLGEREFMLSEFLASPAGVVDGRPFTRREVVKYIANAKGGVHLGGKERDAEKKLIARLKKIEKKISVQTTDGLLVELVAIGQAVGKSADAEVLVHHVLGEN